MSSKRRISWESAAELIEYATAENLQIVDNETNQRICNLLKTNGTKAKDLIDIIRKRMFHRKDSVIRLSVVLIIQTIVECPEVVECYSSAAWNDCFISVILRKNVRKEIKLQVLSLIRGLTESFPTNLFFADLYSDLAEHGITFPEPITFSVYISTSKND